MRVKTLFSLGLSLFTATALSAQEPAGAADKRVQDSIAAARAGIPFVTLADAIGLALKAHPNIVSAQASVDIAHYNQRQGLAQWLPNLSLSSGVSKSPSSRFNPSTGQVVQVTTPYSGNIGINTSLQLFDGGARIFQSKQYNAQAASAEASYVNQKFQVTLLTKQAFFGALAAADLERAALVAVQSAEENLKITKSKLAAGSAIRSDTLTATVRLGQARLQVLNAQTQRANQEATLARLIAFDKPVRAVGDSTVFAIVDIDTVGLRAAALANSPAIATAEAQLRVSQAVVNANKITYLPTLSASYGNSRAGAASSFGGAVDYGSLTPNWSLSLSLGWQLFDRLGRETRLATSKANRETAEANAADARRQVNAQVTQYLASLESARISSGIAQASRAAADETLRVQTERYRLGAATIVDVLTAQQTLDQSQVDAVNARVNYQVAKAQLEALLGRAL